MDVLLFMLAWFAFGAVGGWLVWRTGGIPFALLVTSLGPIGLLCLWLWAV